jgi:hypothetical protein
MDTATPDLFEFPVYCVKRSTLHCDRKGGRNEYPWYVWKIAREGQSYRALGSYRTEEDAHAAADHDRRHGDHRF